MAGKKNARKMPTAAKLVIKTVIAVAMGLFFLFMAVGTVATVAEEYLEYRDDTAAMINACNRSYYEKDYAELLDSLILWELYQDEFDKYWEVCGAYQELTLCQQYSLLEDGAEELLYHRSRLMDISVNCRNEDNVNRIKQMYEESLTLPVPGA